MEPVVYLGWNEIFYWDVCISMQFASFIVVGLAWFYSEFVMGPIQELKVNMVIYLHAHKQAHFVRRFWWLLEWRFQLAVYVPEPDAKAASEWLHRGRGGIQAALHVTAKDTRLLKILLLHSQIWLLTLILFPGFSEIVCLNMQMMHDIINYPLVCVIYQKRSLNKNKHLDGHFLVLVWKTPQLAT